MLAKRVSRSRDPAFGGKRGRKGKENHEVTYDLWFHPTTANVTLSAGATYFAAAGLLSGPGATLVDGAVSVVTSLDDLSNRAEYAALYDAFRINKVEYHYEPVGDVQPNADDLNAATTVVAAPEFLESVIDLDDANLPTTTGEMLEYESYHYTRPSASHVIRYVPKVSYEVFDGVTASFSEADKPIFIDCAQQTTPHYGHKLFIESFGTTSNVQNQWRVWGRMNITFKRTH